jgi:hypothetical protein
MRGDAWKLRQKGNRTRGQILHMINRMQSAEQRPNGATS